MRPRLLELTAFGPYAGQVRIDFGDLADDGVFLVHGPTGAGKTSLLDAMTYALYGGVAGTRRTDRLRSDHADPATPTSVAFEFCLHGCDYRVTRTPQHERAKKSGTGMTVQKPKATLSARRDGEWEPLAEGVEDVGMRICDLIGLNREQFQQVVVLPQGAFAAALHADARHRRDLLSSLFRTGRFDQYTQALVARARRAEDLAADGSAHLGRLQALAAERWQVIDPAEAPQPDVPALAQRATAAAEEARAAVDVATDIEHAASEALHGAKLAAERRRRIDQARATLAQLDEAADELADVRAMVEAALRAQPLAPFVAAASQAATALDAAAAERAAAADTLLAMAETGAAPADDAVHRALEAAAAGGGDASVLGAARDALHAIVVRLTVACTRYEQAQAAARSAQEATAAEHEQRAAAAAAAAALDDLQQQRATVAAATTKASAAAEKLKDLRAEHMRLEQVASAVASARHLQEHCSELMAAGAAAKAQLNRVLDHQRILLERRIEGMAAELAAGLVQGEPCTVCGSASHPQPARPAPDAVSAVALEGAQRDVEVARAAVAAHDEVEAEVRSELHGTLALAGGDVDDPDGLAARLEAAAAALEETAARAAQVPALEATLTALETDAAAAVAAQAAALDAASRAAATADACAQTARELHAEVEEEVGGQAEPAAVLEAARQAAATADALCAARQAEQRLHADADAAQQRLDEMLSTHGFDDAAAAARAVLPEAQLRDLQRQLTAVDTQRAAAEAVLASEDDGGDDDGPAVADLEAVHAEADQALAAAQIRLGVVGQAAQDLQRLAAEFAQAQLHHREVVGGAQRLRRLADICSGSGNEQRMSLERYVLAAYFEEIAETASQRLQSMSGGRYTLRHSDARVRGGGASGLSITVLDAYTGTEREAGSLSGGETFQASLCLALAVAEVVQRHAGGVHLDTLFIDEGFGALDADSLEQAMAELDALREGGRLVGVISHVPALRERISSGIVVTKTTSGSDARVVTLAPL